MPIKRNEDGRLWQIVRQAEREAILDALTRCEGRLPEAALDLGIEETTLWKKIRALGIDRESTKRRGPLGKRQTYARSSKLLPEVPPSSPIASRPRTVDVPSWMRKPLPDEAPVLVDWAWAKR